METSKIKSGEISVVQKRWKDVVCRQEDFFFWFILYLINSVFHFFIYSYCSYISQFSSD